MVLPTYRAPVGDYRPMSTSRAELSSLATALDELTQRITGLADSMAGQGKDEMAADLYGVERALAGAHRRLVRIVDGLNT